MTPKLSSTISRLHFFTIFHLSSAKRVAGGPYIFGAHTGLDRTGSTNQSFHRDFPTQQPFWSTLRTLLSFLIRRITLQQYIH
jgi:hypothetical protein